MQFVNHKPLLKCMKHKRMQKMMLNTCFLVKNSICKIIPHCLGRYNWPGIKFQYAFATACIGLEWEQEEPRERRPTSMASLRSVKQPGQARLLTHWGRDKMDAISQTTFSNAFSWMKMFEFRLKFHWNMFLRVQSTIFQHWFRWWLGAGQATSHYLNQLWLIYRRIYASLGLDELTPIFPTFRKQQAGEPFNHHNIQHA